MNETTTMKNEEFRTFSQKDVILVPGIRIVECQSIFLKKESTEDGFGTEFLIDDKLDYFWKDGILYLGNEENSTKFTITNMFSKDDDWYQETIEFRPKALTVKCGTLSINQLDTSKPAKIILEDCEPNIHTLEMTFKEGEPITATIKHSLIIE